MAKRVCTGCGHPNDSKADRCEGCGVHFPKRERVRATALEDVAPIPTTCEYEDCGVRCQYPPGFTSNTRGGGPYLCVFHHDERDAIVAAELVGTSQSYVPETERGRTVDAQAAADAFCSKHGLQTVAQMRARIREMTGGRAITRELGKVPPSRQWARDLKAREESGYRLTETQRRMYRDALRAEQSTDDVTAEAA